jgi:hypothetical protein
MDATTLDMDLADIHEGDLRALSAEHGVVMREMFDDTERFKVAQPASPPAFPPASPPAFPPALSTTSIPHPPASPPASPP